MQIGPSATTLKGCRTKTAASQQETATEVPNSSESMPSTHNIEAIHEWSSRENCVDFPEMTPFISLLDTSNTASSSESPTRFHPELVNTNILRSMPNEILFEKSSTPPYEEDGIDDPRKGLSVLPIRAPNESSFPLSERTDCRRSGWKKIQDGVGWSCNTNGGVLKWKDHTCAVQICQIATGERGSGRSHWCIERVASSPWEISRHYQDSSGSAPHVFSNVVETLASLFEAV